MNGYSVTIYVGTSADPGRLLDAAIEAAEMIADRVQGDAPEDKVKVTKCVVAIQKEKEEA